jgi:hypothetical protein
LISMHSWHMLTKGFGYCLWRFCAETLTRPDVHSSSAG